jgi:transcriptional regulator with XRE-family HTH domain
MHTRKQEEEGMESEERRSAKAILARRMRDAMGWAGLTQTEVAHRMGESVTNVNRWVKVDGTGRMPGKSALLNFANVVGTTVEALTGDEEPRPPTKAADSLDALQRREGAAAAARAGRVDLIPELNSAAEEVLEKMHRYLDDEWAHLTLEEKLDVLSELMRLRADRHRGNE